MQAISLSGSPEAAFSLLLSPSQSCAPAPSCPDPSTSLPSPPAPPVYPPASRVNAHSISNLPVDDQTLFEEYGLAPARPAAQPFVHRAFEAHAARAPEVVAVEHASAGQQITYGELELRANRLARRLRARGVRPGKRVVILCRRSISYVLAILAALKAGGQYVPLDAQSITDEMLAHVLSDCAPQMVLCMQQYSQREPMLADIVRGKVMVVEEVMEEDERLQADGSKVRDLSKRDDGVYLIYTSGTTGVPKGVDVRHRGVGNVVSGHPGNVGMKPGMRVAQLLNIAFDMCAWEVLGSMYNGCTLCLRGDRYADWVAVLRTVHVVISTPSILLRHDPAHYPTLKHVIVGGEPCPQSLADRWAAFTEFNNCCGPTEISIANTVQKHTPGYPLSIGRPIPNTNVYVLGRDPSDTTPARIGEIGCMWVGGVGVSRGYLNLADKTAERLCPDPFVRWDGHGPRPMMFNTHDLGRWRPDGQLDHCGRADDQVKIRGFRVELDGVATAMSTHPLVSTAVALKLGEQLWGFYAPASVPSKEVRQATAQKLPDYAVPSQWLALDKLPLTPRGKVDKHVLRNMARPEMPSSQSLPDLRAVKREVAVNPMGSPALSDSSYGSPIEQ
ncbi:nonribosomal peptide synthetase [Dacryopinax primogenitus]|uniref:Nonribosomal peptide synthetase n=1 Tax=Dacryopinax primogenitus (strain DJM 731) TaxID=1858805 RepID=M5FU44_DACPD|nr:nonribosomal peptide synthetase [Dacryopinax primogenitus]EJT99014.1 nonribosomal peptide synthetase [Dacryopinax primogenitus]